MEFNDLLVQLETDNAEISVLKNAFRQKSKTAPLILDPADEHKFRRIVPALRDLLIDELPGLGYGEEVEQIFQNGLANVYGSPSKNSVRDINDLVAAIIKRLRRQGKVPDPPVIPGELVQPSSRDEIPYPAKITYAWLKKHVPISMWLTAFGVIVVVFSAGFATGVWLKPLIEEAFRSEMPVVEQPLQDSDT